MIRYATEGTGLRVVWKTNRRVHTATGDLRHENDDWLMLKGGRWDFPIAKCTILRREEI